MVRKAKEIIDEILVKRGSFSGSFFSSHLNIRSTRHSINVKIANANAR
ncbi:MAG: hypothetical protein JSW00_17965 [Thermoplasmata archaeon]|nr:MAG: hypothetical protein JSW00_17965 [Thermoplasmata archaeon]